MAFQRAERRRSFVKVAITGPSGSGKTYSALRLAFGLGKRVAVIDSENGSASLYADVNRDGIGVYDVCEIGPPFTTQKYIQAIKDSLAGGYDVLIIDSLSHAWSGEGGLLTQKEALDARGGNQYTNWGSITKLHEAFKAEILQAPIHVIACMRSKTEYVVETDSRGKSAPRKVGMAPIQRDGMEYEFSLVFDVEAGHNAVASKDRTGLFQGFSNLLTEKDGQKIAAWLNSGAEPAPTPPQPAAAVRPSVWAAGKPAESSGDRAASTPATAAAVQERVVAAAETHASVLGDDEFKQAWSAFMATYRTAGLPTDADALWAWVSQMVGRKIASRADLKLPDIGVLSRSAQVAANTKGGGLALDNGAPPANDGPVPAAFQ